MKCPYHITRNAAGYCSVCGTFVCDECLSHNEGVAYCPKHFKSIATKLKREENSAEIRKRHGRHHLIVYYLDGSQTQGTCRSMDLRGTGFYLELEDDTGISLEESRRVQFIDVKYVGNVKSYTGNFDKHEQFDEYTPGGTHIVVKFRDGNVVEGTTMHAYVPDHPRFYLIPHDRLSNYINMLIEAKSVERVYNPQDYVAEMKHEKELRRQQKELAQAAGNDTAGTVANTATDNSELSQEESMGDFYFGTHNYPGALEQYRIARNANLSSSRLKKKVVVTLINIGIQYIKTREYPKSLEYMEQALQVDPQNPHAKKKSKQLKKIIEKTERRMREYYEQQAGESGGNELL
jgi:hypothetical protein